MADDYLDTVFDVLASQERRYIMDYMQQEGYASTDELADYLVERTGKDEQAVEVELYHTHLGKLEAAGWIDYDERSGDISTQFMSDSSSDRQLLEYIDSFESEEQLGSMFDLLSEERRRKTLHFLEYDQDRRSTLMGIANHLSPDPQERSRTIPRLHHTDLPKLDDAGLVTYNPASQKVTLTPTDDDKLILDYLHQLYSEE